MSYTREWRRAPSGVLPTLKQTVSDAQNRYAELMETPSAPFMVVQAGMNTREGYAVYDGLDFVSTQNGNAFEGSRARPVGCLRPGFLPGRLMRRWLMLREITFV